MPPGGLKWTPFGAGTCSGVGAAATLTAGPVRALERACERLVRRVARVESDREQVGLGGKQSVRRPLEQDPPPQRAGRLARDGCDKPIGVEAREMQPRSKPGAVHVGLVKRLGEDANKAGEGIGSSAHVPRSSPDSPSHA